MRSKKLGRLIQLVTWGLVAAAVIKELQKEPDDREWHGLLGDLVPYDFRPPTMERIRQAWWNPEGPIFTPQVFGVGWTVNVGKLVEAAREQAS
jgi:hypothetical protein